MIATETSGFVLMAAVFGLTAGISPGPLLTLVISETISHNKSGGIKVALAPLITDLPIVTLAFIVFSRYSQFSIILNMISFTGGIFLVYLGYECIKTKGMGIDIEKGGQKSLVKGVIANLLNPHPYLFWITIGVPLALKAYQVNLTTLVLYFLAFYTLLIGSKIAVALLADKSKEFLTNNLYIWIMRILGFLLFIFAVLFFVDSIKGFID
jgi:threonine/homoserine/homoserine lactone efflux protein